MPTAVETLKLELQGLIEPGQANKADAKSASSEALRRSFTVHGLTAAEGTAATQSDEVIWRNPSKVKLISARFIPNLAINGDGGNYANVQIRVNDDAGGAQTVVAYMRIGTGGDVANLVGNRSAGFVVNTAGDTNVVSAGSAWHFATVKTGAGAVVPVSRVVIEYEVV
jgi:hypothetical protein